MKVYKYTCTILILSVSSMISCQQVSLNEDQTDLLLTNMEAYLEMLGELNKLETNKLSYHMRETPGISTQVKKAYDQIKLLDDSWNEVFNQIMEVSRHKTGYVYFADRQSVEDADIRQMEQVIGEFNDLVKPLSKEIYEAMVVEQSRLFGYLESVHPVGIVNLATMKYCVKMELLMNHLFRSLSAIEITPNARINYADPYFAIEIVPEYNILFDGDSLRFKLIDFAYFKAHPDSITFSRGGQEFSFGKHFAEIRDQIPVQQNGPREKELVTKTNYGLWLHYGYTGILPLSTLKSGTHFNTSISCPVNKRLHSVYPQKQYLYHIPFMEN